MCVCEHVCVVCVCEHVSVCVGLTLGAKTQFQTDVLSRSGRQEGAP